jgi:hypothetical protein
MQMMKKLLYLTGFLGSATLALGATFKLLHLPGANQLYIIGFLVVLLIFVHCLPSNNISQLFPAHFPSDGKYF